MKERYEVSIAGTEMVLLSEESEDYVKNLAQILDRRVMDMVIVKNRCTKIEALTLCAMDYLDATVKLQAELEELKAKMSAPAKPAIEIEPYGDEKVDFDTFCKSDFRAVKVKGCKNVKKSDKLLQFTLDDGTGTDRQILSGIAKFYKPEELIGKTLVAITNLPPRKMMGRESCGMLISAVHTENGEEKLNLLMIDDAIPAGAKLC